MLIVNFLFVIQNAFAGGTMQLSGEVYGFTDKNIQISDGQNIFTIERSKIFNKAPLAKNLKRGDHVEVTAAFEGVIETQEVKTK